MIIIQFTPEQAQEIGLAKMKRDVAAWETSEGRLVNVPPVPTIPGTAPRE